MAVVTVGRMAAEGAPLWTGLGMRAALLHRTASCHEKWDNKWKTNAYGYMDADSCRKRHNKYVKRQKRAADKRSLLKWRSLEMNGDDYREVQERRRQQAAASAEIPHTSNTFSWSRRFEKEWRRFCKDHKGRQGEKSHGKTTSGEQGPDDFSSGSSEKCYNHDNWNSEHARYKRQFWNHTWRIFGGFGDNYPRTGPTPGAHTASNASGCEQNIGSPTDRLALGLSPAGPLTLDDLKLAFRQCALTWHPDRHHGEKKSLAEAKFKRIGAAYRTLHELLSTA